MNGIADCSHLAVGPMQRTAAEGRDLLRRLEAFCQAYGGECYAGWPPSMLRDYLVWHATEATLSWACAGKRVIGVGVLYPCDEVELRTAHRMGENVFCYRPLDWTEDSVYLADFIATEPGVLAGLLRSFWERFPQGRSKKWFCHRREKLIELKGSKYVGLIGLPKGDTYGEY